MVPLHFPTDWVVPELMKVAQRDGCDWISESYFYLLDQMLRNSISQGVASFLDEVGEPQKQPILELNQNYTVFVQKESLFYLYEIEMPYSLKIMESKNRQFNFRASCDDYQTRTFFVPGFLDIDRMRVHSSYLFFYPALMANYSHKFCIHSSKSEWE